MSIFDRRKRGRISREEDKKIGKFVKDGLDAKAISEKLRRPLGQIEDYLKHFYGKGDNLPAKAPEVADFTRQLRNSVHWKKLQEHYTKQDLEYYETIYADLMHQFQDDVTAVDDLQILQLIDAHMLNNEHKKRRKALNEKLFEIEREINKLYLDISDPEVAQKINILESQRQALTQQDNKAVKIFSEISKKLDDTTKALKSTRNQRLQSAENSTQSFTALIKHLQDKKIKEKEGRYAAMVKFSVDKKTKELQQPHKYINGQIDQPMLVPENVLITKDQYEQTEES